MGYPKNWRLEIWVDWEAQDELMIYHRRGSRDGFLGYPIIFSTLKDIENQVARFLAKYQYPEDLFVSMYKGISYTIHEDSPCVS